MEVTLPFHSHIVYKCIYQEMEGPSFHHDKLDVLGIREFLPILGIMQHFQTSQEILPKLFYSM